MQVWPALTASVALALALVPGSATGGQPVARQYTNLTSFSIGFKLPAAATSTAVPRLVELHASSDSGVTWNLVGKAKPSEKGILFRAPKDGEYWFMPRTKYASGLYLPKGPPTPEMKVVVDTTPPTLDLNAQNDDGEIVVRWHVADVNLKRETFKIEYKAAVSGDWQTISIDPDIAPEQAGESRGDTTVVLPIAEQTAAIVVRAEASDEAGNRTVKEQPLAASRSGSEAASPSPGEDDEFPPEMSPTFTPAADRGDGQPSAPPSYPRTEDWQAEESPPLVNDSAQLRSNDGRPPQQNLVSLRANSAVYRLRDFPETTPVSDAPSDSLSPPQGVEPHRIDKQRFELIYDVEAVGAGGIAKVELWITSDCGRTWTSYGFDEDCRSPMPVKVESDGLYGFRVVVETTAGLRSPTPLRGDLPDVWVEVDRTVAAARLISAERGQADEADRLIICWSATDPHLAARGISLRWSDSPQGPWATIASGLENTGRYAWRVDPRVPRQIYLLLEVRDKAGNVATDRLSQPVSLDLLVPQGRIREVRPLGAAPPAGSRR